MYVIYDTDQHKLWNSNGSKIGWCSTAAAKNAWNLCSRTFYDENDRPVKLKFDQQSRYVIVEISDLLVKSLVEEKK